MNSALVLDYHSPVGVRYCVWVDADRSVWIAASPVRDLAQQVTGAESVVLRCFIDAMVQLYDRCGLAVQGTGPTISIAVDDPSGHLTVRPVRDTWELYSCLASLLGSDPDAPGVSRETLPRWPA